MNKLFRYFSFIFLVGMMVTSCVSKKKLNYLQEFDALDSKQEFENIRTEKKIDFYDKLYIKVYNLDPDINALFKEQGSVFTNTALISYTVNDDGYIDFPFAGKIKLDGLTIEQAKNKLQDELNKFIPNTSVILKYVGNTITVMGEVNRQGEYDFYDDKINIFQALSFAGGINNLGDKSKVSVIREINNQISIHELNLSKKNIVESPYYYLNPNDIVVVAPINAKYRSYRDFALISVVTSIITTSLVVINFINSSK